MNSISAKHTSASLYLKGVYILLFSILYPFAFSQEYNFRNLNESDGLAQSFVYSIIQDQRGYLWVGTGNGISRYNGFGFKNFTTEDSLADNFITSGITDDHDLWFGHMNGGISLYNGRHFRVLHKPTEDMSPVTHLARSPDGRIWSISASGVLMKLEKGKGAMQSYAITELQESVVTFEFLGSRELLIGTGTGLYHGHLGDSGNVKILRKVPEIPESKVVCITRARNGDCF
jgi:ligand-binding sensor domain-containing protein